MVRRVGCRFVRRRPAHHAALLLAIDVAVLLGGALAGEVVRLLAHGGPGEFRAAVWAWGRGVC